MQYFFKKIFFITLIGSQNIRKSPQHRWGLGIFCSTFEGPWLKCAVDYYAHTRILGGRAYPVRHYPIAIRLRDRKGRAILCVARSPQNGDSSGATLEVPSEALLHLEATPTLRSPYASGVTALLYLRTSACLWHSPESTFAKCSPFANDFSPKSELLFKSFANVHFLLYLCRLFN